MLRSGLKLQIFFFNSICFLSEAVWGAPGTLVATTIGPRPLGSLAFLFSFPRGKTNTTNPTTTKTNNTKQGKEPGVNHTGEPEPSGEPHSDTARRKQRARPQAITVSVGEELHKRVASVTLATQGLSPSACGAAPVAQRHRPQWSEPQKANRRATLRAAYRRLRARAGCPVA